MPPVLACLRNCRIHTIMRERERDFVRGGGSGTRRLFTVSIKKTANTEIGSVSRERQRGERERERERERCRDRCCTHERVFNWFIRGHRLPSSTQVYNDNSSHVDCHKGNATHIH
ncbi:hypothetical protein KP509_01G035000 [Ceratopteris richardii]|uniref:Uncharacterized protein n=1 Tax=Ceratopteris richardii TaxID=49495 RepID=A0A8T2VIX0_CERRI|nr:hypothetical protein KP509_01G035000 [Ceratopteris richardii]